jgi:PAS domain S-box-containing protein
MFARSFTLRVHLSAIVFVALVPAFTVGGAVVWLALSSYQRASDERLRDTVSSVALLLQREIENHVTTLQTLAASPLLDAGPDGDMGAFYGHAHRTAKIMGAPIVLFGPELSFRLATDQPLGAILPPSVVVASARQALEIGRPTVSDLFSGAMPQRPMIAVNVPVLREGRAIAVLAARLTPEYLSQLLARTDLSRDTVVSVTDGQNILIARSHEAERFVGRHAPDWYGTALSGREEGFATGRSLAGDDTKIAFQRVKGSSRWTVMVLEPLAVYYATWRSPIVALMLSGGLVTLLALVFAQRLGRRIRVPVALLAQKAEAVASGGGVFALSSVSDRHFRVAEFEALRRAIRRAGAAMERSERRNRALAENGSVALWRAEPDGYLLESRGWELLTGQGPEDLRGSGWLEAVHPDDGRATMTRWRQAMAKRMPTTAEYRVRARDGRWLWHRVRAVPLLDETGEITEWVGTVENIDDSKNAEARVAASEARLRALVDTAPDAILVIDGMGLIRSFNQGAERIFGYDAAEVIGQNIAMLMPEPHAKQHDGYLENYRRTGTRHVIGATTSLNGLRKDGEAVPLEASIGEWRDAEGTLFFTGVLRDVTERRASEERQTLLAREVDHRAKNALAVVQSMLRLTPARDIKSFVAAVEARVTALARAHSLLSQEGWRAADFRAVADRELAAHARRKGQSNAITLEGPPFRLPSIMVQPMAMVLHELAANAVKHGALSAASGEVRLVWRVDEADDLLHLQWTESGGPDVSPPSRRGFGSRLIEATVRSQLGGTLERHWKKGGLVCEFHIPLNRISVHRASAAA